MNFSSSQLNWEGKPFASSLDTTHFPFWSKVNVNIKIEGPDWNGSHLFSLFCFIPQIVLEEWRTRHGGVFIFAPSLSYSIRPREVKNGRNFVYLFLTLVCSVTFPISPLIKLLLWWLHWVVVVSLTHVSPCQLCELFVSVVVAVKSTFTREWDNNHTTSSWIIFLFLLSTLTQNTHSISRKRRGNRENNLQ